METIRRKICLEKSRNRKSSVLPFIQYNVLVDDNDPTSGITNITSDSSNWGGFTADFNYTFTGSVFDTEETMGQQAWNWDGLDGLIRSREMLRRYNVLLDILRNGIFVERIKDRLCGNTSYDNRYRPIVDESATTEDLIFKCTPAIASLFSRDIYGIYTQIEDTDHLFTEPYGNLISDIDTYNALGGIDYVRAVHNILEGNLSVDANKIPYLDCSILLTDQMGEIGVMTDYDEGEETEDFSPLSPHKGTVNVETNSKLSTLRYPIYAMGDDEVLPGLFQEWNNNSKGGQTMKFTGIEVWDKSISAYTYEWTGQTVSVDLECADGEEVGPNESKYRTLTIEASIGRYLPSASEETVGDYYYFFVRYNNNSIATMTIPYVTNVAYNISVVDSGSSKYRGDFITDITKTSSSVTFTYVIQGIYQKSGNSISYLGSGITYTETYGYDPCATTAVTIDGAEDVTIYYQKIDFNTNSEEIYSEDFNLTTTGNLTTIQDYILEDVWQKGSIDGESPINVPVFKEEYTMGAAFASKTDVNVEIDRGNAAAFERHFILGECNTFEDLENYRNNMFNIDED